MSYLGILILYEQDLRFVKRKKKLLIYKIEKVIIFITFLMDATQITLIVMPISKHLILKLLISLTFSFFCTLKNSRQNLKM